MGVMSTILNFCVDCSYHAHYSMILYSANLRILIFVNITKIKLTSAADV